MLNCLVYLGSKLVCTYSNKYIYELPDPILNSLLPFISGRSRYSFVFMSYGILLEVQLSMLWKKYIERDKLADPRSSNSIGLEQKLESGFDRVAGP
jgi:hypothetical protein